jgi:hypothetical protein
VADHPWRMAQIPREAAGQFAVFTTSQAIEAGWTRSALGRATVSGRLRRIRTGAYLAPDAAFGCLPGPVSAEPGQDNGRFGQARRELQVRGVAAALLITNSTLSHQAAAVTHGLAIFGQLSDRPCLTVRPGFRVGELGTHLHRVALPSGQVCSSGGLRFTSVARTCLDLAREFGLASGLVAAEDAVRRGLTTRSELEAVYGTMRGRGGSPAARDVVQFVDGRHESPLETISALALRSLPEQPRPQVSLFAPGGEFLARCDFLWERLGVVGEADGRAKYASDQLWREKRREDRLRAHGLVVVRWGFEEAIQRRLLLATVQRGFQQAEMLRAAGISPTALEHNACGPPSRFLLSDRPRVE